MIFKMAKAPREQTSNAAFEGDVRDNNPGEHSSIVPSTDHFGNTADHSQWDEAEQDIDHDLDPNLSGTNPTKAMHSEKAGPLNAWGDNQDYRLFLETGRDVESALVRSVVIVGRQRNLPNHDGDYDDNHGIPQATSGYMSVGEPGYSDRESGPTIDEVNEFPVNVVQRRI
jgi:hypothetical protein